MTAEDHAGVKWPVVGFSGIVNQDITDSFGLALRGEYFDDNDGARLAVSGPLDIWEITLTANIKIRENLLVRPEIRYDEASQDVFDGRRGRTHNGYCCRLYVLGKLLLLFKNKGFTPL